jgi:hypothetical protein
MIKAPWLSNSILCFSIAGLAACASTPNKNSDFIAPGAQAVPKNTISINYSLRHNAYLFQLQSVGDAEFTAKSTVNDKVIEDRKIARDKYISIANRIYDFAEKYKKTQGTVAECKAPFNIRLVKSGEVTEVQGCRSNDESGELGKIIREGEILFYSQE